MSRTSWARFSAGFASGSDPAAITGLAIPPNGRLAALLSLGGVAACGMPELSGSIKVKALTGIVSENFVNSCGISVSFVKKLRYFT